MQRFFLHIRDGATLLKDSEGSLLPNVEAAREEAIQSAREILAAKVLAGELIDGQTFEITDETGAFCATFPFKDAMSAGKRGRVNGKEPAMWQRAKRGTFWALALLLVSAGGGLLHSAFTSYRQDPVETFFGLLFALSGLAIYWHVIRPAAVSRQ